MAKTRKKHARAIKTNSATSAENGKDNGELTTRKSRRSLAVTERGITSDSDLSEFFSTVISDLNAGRMDLREAAVMSSFSGKMIALANLQFKLGVFGGKSPRPSIQLLTR